MLNLKPRNFGGNLKKDCFGGCVIRIFRAPVKYAFEPVQEAKSVI